MYLAVADQLPYPTTASGIEPLSMCMVRNQSLLLSFPSSPTNPDDGGIRIRN